MNKKLHLALLALLFSLVFYGQQTITMSTTTSTPSWRLGRVTNSGAIFQWQATNDLVSLSATENNPTFDFSSNDGRAINITITSSDNFSGFTELDLSNAGSGDPSAITGIDISNATNLRTFAPNRSSLASIDISQNIALTRLFIIGNSQVPDQALNTSTNPQLFHLRIDGSGINAVDLSNNPLLTNVQLNNARLSAAVLDQVLIDLDNHGLPAGNLQIRNNPGSLAISALTAYNNLIGKGWTIDVPAPVGPVFQTITMTTTTVTPAWRLGRVTNSGDILQWQAQNDLINLTATENNPTFDFTGNDGRPIDITISSTDNFIGLTQLDLSNAASGDLSAITTIDISKALNLTTFAANRSSLTGVDVTQNTALQRLFILGNGQVPDQALNISVNTQLFDLRITGSGINSVDLSNNPLLTNVLLNNARLTSSVLDQVLIDLDNHGLSNGNLEIRNQTTGQSITFNSLIAYNNLVTKGWTIDVPAPAAAPGPEINVSLGGTSIPTGNVPAIADGTDFGQVVIGSPVTKTFTIENLGDTNLQIYSGTTNGTAGFSQIPPFINPIIPAAGGSITFNVTFTPPVVPGVQTAQIIIASTDSNENPYIVNLRAEGVTVITNPSIVVLGNGLEIANGDVSPDITDNTNFGQVENNLSKTNQFTIENDGTDDLEVTGIDFTFGAAAEFSIVAPAFPQVIVPGGSITFDVVFSPITNGTYSAGIEIESSDPDENPFNFLVSGVGIENIVSGDIMITQYYEGSTTSKWIEVVNRSAATIPAGTYFLVMYDQDEILNIETQGPSPGRFVSIPELTPGQVALFSNTSATLPLASNIGIPIAEVTETTVCDFDGNDVILISSATDATCYANREDIVGTVPSTNWGTNISYIRGGNSDEVPQIDFNANNWIELSPSADVDFADTSTNMALGNQAIGRAIWNGSSWDNFAPDKTRDVEISGTYTALNGNIDAYDLLVSTGVDLDFNSGTLNSIILRGGLTVNGTFTIGDTESLVMINDNATITGVITKLESSTERTNQHDVTYWSSPVSNETIGSVFAGVTPSRIFYYDQNNSTGTDPATDPTYWNTWVIASGPMRPGFGYAAEGPTGTTGVHNVSFTGRPNNGLVAFDIYEISDGELDNDWNLVGNPYPSAIDIRDFFTLNSGVIWSEIWLWTHTTAISGGNSGDFVSSDYAVYNSTGGVGVAPGEDPTYNIGSGQGFFVRGEEGSGGLLRFNNSLRIANLNNQFFKSENTKSKPSAGQNDETDRIWLNLTSDENGFNQILIGFSELATSGIDKGYDALKKRSDNPLSFYSNIEGKKYVIQGLGEFSERESNVTLGFDTKVAPRVLTISIDKTEGKLTDADVYLVDNLLNKTHDLKKSDYQFEQTTISESTDRFTLKFTRSNAGGNSDKSKEGLFVVSSQDNDLKIRSDKTIRNIKVYDMFGRLLIEQTPNTDSFYLKTDRIKTGTVILLESTFEDGSVVKRKTIKY